MRTNVRTKGINAACLSAVAAAALLVSACGTNQSDQALESIPAAEAPTEEPLSNDLKTAQVENRGSATLRLAFVDSLGVTLGDVTSAVEQEQLRRAQACLNDQGLDGDRIDGYFDRSYDRIPDTAAEQMLIAWDLSKSQPAELPADETFRAAAIACRDQVGTELPGPEVFLAPFDAALSATNSAANSDRRMHQVNADYDACIEDLGFTEERTTEDEFQAIADDVFEVARRFEQGKLTEPDARNQLNDLHLQQLKLEDEISPCVDEYEQRSGAIRGEHQIDYLTENPTFISETTAPIRDEIRSLVEQDTTNNARVLDLQNAADQ